MTPANELAARITETLTANGVRVLGARGGNSMLAFVMTREHADFAHTLLQQLLQQAFGQVAGVTIELELWSPERAEVYARNVPAEAGAQARIRIRF